MIKYESKKVQDDTRNINYEGQQRLKQEYQEAMRLERECIDVIHGVDTVNEVK